MSSAISAPTSTPGATAQIELPPPPTNPAGTEADEEMRSENGADSGAEENNPALKRKRTDRDEYTVSKSGPSHRDQSPLRKLPTQCDWDKEARSIPTPLSNHVEWVRHLADKRPFNSEYDEARYVSVPAYRYANPHFRKTQHYDLDEKPLDGHDAFTPGPFPHVHISDWRHLGNIKEQQKKMIEENIENMLALVPHGGGRAYTKQGAALAKIYEKFFRSVIFAGYDGEDVVVTVIPPDPRNAGGPNSQNHFAQPWAFYLLLEGDDKLLMRMFLLWQEHFAIDQSRSFSIHPLVTDRPQTWKLLVLVWPHADWAAMSHNDVLEKRKATLAILTKNLKASGPYRDRIATLAATKINHTGSRDQIFKTVTDSFHLEPASAETRNGPRAAFVLLARPLTEESSDLRQLKGTMIEAVCGGMHGDHFYVGTHKVIVVDDTSPSPSATVDCKLCKSDIHRTADCPLPKTKGWRGITAAALGRDDRPETDGQAVNLEEDPREVLNNVLTSIRGETKGPGSSKGKNGQGKPSNGGRRGRAQGSHGGGKGKGPARA